MIASLLSLGLFVAVPVVGSAIVTRWCRPLPPAAHFAVAVATGLTIWTVPLLGSILLRIYRPELLGAVAWIATVAALLRGRSLARRWMPRRWTDWVLIIGLTTAGFAYALAPAETLDTGRDMAVYAAHGTFIAENGRIDVPYPTGTDGADRPGGWIGYAGVYTRTSASQTVQFGHLFPAWLAQAQAVGDYGVLQRVNPALALVSALAVYAVARRWMDAGLAVVVTLLLAFNPAQVWLARNTLTEIMTQLFIWAAFVLLLAHRAPDRRSIALAGVFIGMASLVRIDSLVLVPLFLVGWAIADARTDDLPRPRPSLAFLTGLIPVSAAAVAYFAVFSNPYFTDLGEELRLIGVGAIVAAVVYGATFVGPIRHLVGRAVGSWALIGLVGIGVLCAAAYAYFIRPSVGPFEIFDRPGHPLDGTRTHVEDAMRNLGRYLGSPTVWLGVSAWVALMAFATKWRPSWLPVLVVIGGFTSLYAWDQSIFPDHFWAIRRFIPVIIPALAVLAGVAVWAIVRRLPGGGRILMTGAVAVLAAIHTWQVARPTLFVADRAGVYEALDAAARSVPDQRVLPILDRTGVRALGTPLFMVFDVQLAAVDATTAPGAAWVRDQLASASPEHPVTVITNLRGVANMLDGDVLHDQRTEVRRIISTTDPPPRETGYRAFELIVKRVGGVDPTGIPFGGASHWFVADEGLHEPEAYGSGTARWTSGHASFTVPLGDTVVNAIDLFVAQAAPAGSTLRVRVNGSDVAEIMVPSEGWSGKISLADPVSAMLELELVSNTFVPAETMDSTDQRALGVLLHRFVLLGSDED